MKAKLKENVIAFVIAVLLAWWVIIAINNSSNLSTDILGVKKNTNVKADFSVYLSWNELKFVSNKDIDNVANLSLELSYDSSKIKINKDNVDSKYSFNLVQNDKNSATLSLNVNKISVNETLFTIKWVTKNMFNHINIWNIAVVDNNERIVHLTSSK